MRICKEKECDNKHYGLGYCLKHYLRVKRYGNPNVVNSSRPTPLVERFWSKVAVTANPDKCWEWLDCKTPKGYGRFSIKNVGYRAHRVAWFLTYNVWPELCILHKCDNPSCVNPDHLWEGTDMDNMRDMISKGRGKQWGHNTQTLV